MKDNEVEVKVEICREDVKLPEYANPWDAGMDVRAAETVEIAAGETKIVPTGLKFAIPEGYEIQVRPRSGLSLKTPLRISNSPGTIDCGYRDELGIIITNASPVIFENNKNQNVYKVSGDKHGYGTYIIDKGDRIAQIVLQKVPRIKFKLVQSVKDYGTDRKGGFGSTGV